MRDLKPIEAVRQAKLIRQVRKWRGSLNPVWIALDVYSPAGDRAVRLTLRGRGAQP